MSIVQNLATRVAASISKSESPYFVAICGWADTGKSTLAAELCDALNCNNVGADWISTDAFLKNRAERNNLRISGYNPLSIDANELSIAVNRLALQDDYTYCPYDNRIGGNTSIPKKISPESVIVIEGIHAFHSAVSRLCLLRLFIDSDVETLRAMRVRANKVKRGMNDTEASVRVDGELQDYRTHILPRKTLANVAVNVSSAFEYVVQSDTF